MKKSNVPSYLQPHMESTTGLYLPDRPDLQHSLVSCAITARSERPTYAAVTVYEDMVIVERKHHETLSTLPKNSGTSYSPKRGLVTSFSKRSRKRLIDKVAQKRNTVRLLFMTLTYPDEVYFDRKMSGEEVKANLHALIQRFTRKWDSVGLIWRLEVETRKSGRFEGECAPHFHLIVDGITDDLGGEQGVRAWLNNAWREIIGFNHATKQLRTDVQVAKNKRHCYYYVSKYVSKVTPQDEEKISEFFKTNAGSLGRHWGVVGLWETTPYLHRKMTWEEFIKFRRSVSSWLKSKDRRTWAKRVKHSPDTCGFSCYGLGAQSLQEFETVIKSTVFRMLTEDGL